MFGSPHCGGGETPAGGGGAYLAASANMRPITISGGQVENAMVPPGLNTRSISADRDVGAGREHVTVLAEHDIELAVVERQFLDVAFVKIDRHLRDRGVLARALEQFGRQVKSRHPRSSSRRRDRDDAGAARHVEHAVSGLDAGERDELCGRRRGGDLERPEVRPPFTLVLLELYRVRP